MQQWYIATSNFALKNFELEADSEAKEVKRDLLSAVPFNLIPP